MANELSELKAQAKELGLAFSPNIGEEALRKKIEAVTVTPIGSTEPDAEAVAKTQQVRNVKKEALRLIRCRIANNDPAKNDLMGDFYTVCNSVIGKVTKYVPFRGTAAESYHIPYCIYQFLKTKKFVQITPATGSNLNATDRAQLMPEFTLEVLEPLTKEELAELAKEQAAGNRID